MVPCARVRPRKGRSPAEQAGIERHQFLFRPGRTPKQDPGEPGQAVDLDQDFRKLGVTDGTPEHPARRFDAWILWLRLAPGDPEFVALDGDGASLDSLGQGGKSSGQARFQTLKIFLCAVRQVEVADEAPPVALPEFQGDQLVLGSPIGQAVIDRDRPVSNRPLQSHGCRAKATECGHPIRLIDQTLPGRTERLGDPAWQGGGGRRGDRIERRKAAASRWSAGITNSAARAVLRSRASCWDLRPVPGARRRPGSPCAPVQGRDQAAQPRPQFGDLERFVTRQPREIAEQLTESSQSARPCFRGAFPSVAPQRCDPVIEKREACVRHTQQGEAQEAGDSIVRCGSLIAPASRACATSAVWRNAPALRAADREDEPVRGRP